MKTALEMAEIALQGNMSCSECGHTFGDKGDGVRLLAQAVKDLTKELEDSHKPLPHSRLAEYENGKNK